MYNFCIKAGAYLADSFENQMAACGRMLFPNVETDDALDGVPLLDMDGEMIERYRNILIRESKKIVLMDSAHSPDDIPGIKQLFRKAHLLNVENIRLEPKGENFAGNLSEILKIAYLYGIGIVLENSRSGPLDSDDAIAGLMRKTGDYRPDIIFNPMEFAATKRHPFFHVFYNCHWKQSIKFLRVNDGLFSDGSPAMPAQGNAEIKEMASALLARSFNGYFSFYPYFDSMDAGKCNDVVKKFKDLLMAM